MTREEQIKKQADIYIGHQQDLGEDISITNKRNAFIKGAKWADKTMIDKACELLNILLYNRYAGNGQHEAASCENITKKEFIENFKRLMEE